MPENEPRLPHSGHRRPGHGALDVAIVALG